MESSRNVRAEKRGYEQGQDVDGVYDETEHHSHETKRPKLPGLARFVSLCPCLCSYGLF